MYLPPLLLLRSVADLEDELKITMHAALMVCFQHGKTSCIFFGLYLSCNCCNDGAAFRGHLLAAACAPSWHVNACSGCCRSLGHISSSASSAGFHCGGAAVHTTVRSRAQDTLADKAAAATAAVLKLCPLLLSQFQRPLQTLQDCRGDGAQLISESQAGPAGEAAAQRPAITTNICSLHSGINSAKSCQGPAHGPSLYLKGMCNEPFFGCKFPCCLCHSLYRDVTIVSSWF